MEGNESARKRTKIDDTEDTLTPMERVKNSTTPLWNIPYEQQVI